MVSAACLYFIVFLIGIIPQSQTFVEGITTLMEQLDQQTMPYSPDIPVITGPFYVEVEVEFHDLISSTWQRMFDFATDLSSHHIFLTKHGSAPGNVAFQYYDDDDNSHWLSVNNQITIGVSDTWRVGVDATGLMTLHKNGILLTSKTGVVPPTGAVLRTQQNLAQSTPTGANGLDGILSNLKVHNLSDPEVPAFRSLANMPAQVLDGKFVASVYARVDEIGTRSDQPIFDFRDQSGGNVIRFRQSGSGTAVTLEVDQNGVVTTCTTNTGAIIEDEMLLWKLQMDGGSWTIKRNGLNGSSMHSCTGIAPSATLRTTMQFGRSPGLPLLDGIVLGFRLDGYALQAPALGIDIDPVPQPALDDDFFAPIVDPIPQPAQDDDFFAPIDSDPILQPALDDDFFD